MASPSVASRTATFRVVPIVCLALALRVAVALLVARSHGADWFFGQATELGSLAESLRTGHGLSSPFGGSTGPSAFLSPGYPALVAAVFAIFKPYSNTSDLTILGLQVAFSAATVLVVMLLARRLFGVRVANITGLICALAPPALYLPTLFWETTLSVLLATSLLALATRCAEERGAMDWLYLALCCAVAISVNPSLLPIVVACLGWAGWRTSKKSLLPAAAAAVVVVLLSTPWAVRNYTQLHAFIPLRSNVGYELWQGNRVGSDGFFLAGLHPNTNASEFARYQELGEVGYMHEKSVTAMNLIKAEPGRFVELTVKRIFFFWTGVGRTSSGLVVAYVSLITLAGFAGLIMLWRSNRAVAVFCLTPLLLFPAPYYITHPDFRFRLILDPLLVMLGAYGVSNRRPL